MRLAKIAERVSNKTDIQIGFAPQYTDIRRLSRETSLPILAQHIDPIEPGGFTGHILPEAVREAGALGTLINHSERRLKLAAIDASIHRARQIGLAQVVCTNNAAVSASVASLGPDFIAIEPPELIGTGVSVSKAKPQVITETIEHVSAVNREVAILCGAGITDGEDVASALKLGSEGILVASGVVKAKNPGRVLAEFAQAISSA